LLPTSALVGIQENIQQFISQLEASLHGEDLVAPLTIVLSDDVHFNMKRKLDFDELKSTSTQKPTMIFIVFCVTFLCLSYTNIPYM
jgi:hypothetical protein